MSDTPRTDAEAQKSRPPFAFVTRKYAEQLERELNAANAELERERIRLAACGVVAEGSRHILDCGSPCPQMEGGTMSERATPETDYVTRQLYGKEYVPARAARKLERERDAEREDIAFWIRQCGNWKACAVRLTRCVRAEDKLRPLLFEADFKKALADFDRLQEEGK
jgi:hypothetical protein